jgi:hypothetical protein
MRRDSRPAREFAERLTRQGLFGVQSEEAPLDARDLVRRWLHEQRSGGDQQVLVHRSWGTLAAVPDRRQPTSVIMNDDGDRAWFAAPPGAGDDTDLTPDQIEWIVLDALTSSGPPAWPRWRRLF